MNAMLLVMGGLAVSVFVVQLFCYDCHAKRGPIR